MSRNSPFRTASLRPRRKLGIYRRYSSYNQQIASIADQLRICRAFGERQAGRIAHESSDHAVRIRRYGSPPWLPIADSQCIGNSTRESLDRFSRDGKTPPASSKSDLGRPRHRHPRPGRHHEPSHGFKGTMNALFLKYIGTKLVKACAASRRERMNLSCAGVHARLRLCQSQQVLGPSGMTNHGRARFDHSTSSE